jgi:signal transduction histidine kinase/ActR/RegA family two-component response regulator
MVESVAKTDASRALLELTHHLLSAPVSAQPDAPALLAQIATAADAHAAGLVSYPDARQGFLSPDRPERFAPVSWLSRPDWLSHAFVSATALPMERDGGEPDLVARVSAGHDAWLLWLEPKPGRRWTDAEAAALSLVASALGRLLEQHAPRPRWGEQLDLTARQQRLEAAAAVTRRLAHDFGNVLTGILGFTELALAQQTPSSASLHAYLSEAYRAAQAGAQYTNQLRQFSCRQPLSSRGCQVGAVLSELEGRLFSSPEAGTLFRLDVASGLPGVAIEGEQLAQVLTALLDNSREALVGGCGAVSVSARHVELSAAECGRFYGDTRPGPHVEVTVADTGCGLSPEAMQKLFVEPFFSTKVRRRGGFGLAIAYGILSAHKGGLYLHPGEERGVIGRVVLPVAVTPAAITPVQPEAASAAGGGERLLVVDDDEEVLNFVVASLARAGFRPTGFRDPAEALHAYFAGGPYQLVLTDVVMSPFTGVELARRVLRRDPAARVVFMSAKVSSDFMQQDFAGKTIDFLAKPFRPEQLVRAVRAGLDRRGRAVLSGTAPV